jgi:mono/diheme cytochrome c family protein
MKTRLACALVGLGALACTGKYVRPTTQEAIQPTPGRLERGSYLVNSVMFCGTCHTPRVGDTWLGGERADAYLAGGGTFDDPEAGFLISSPNITPDPTTGIGAWTDDEILRAIRDGVHRDGSLLRPPMPFYMYDVLSDEDGRAVVAYLRSVPPIKNAVPRTVKFPFMLKVAMAFGMIHHAPVSNVQAPKPSDRQAHGGYLSRLGLCSDCHSMTDRGPDVKGNLLGGSSTPLAERQYGKVWARNLTPDRDTGLGKYTAEQIKAALRSGKRLDGKPMAPPMSLVLPHISTWSDDDLDALIVYLRSVPAIQRKVPEPQLTADARKSIGL